MGCGTNTGCSGWGRDSGRGGHGQGGCGRGASVSAAIPRKASEVGACKDLEGHIFTIGLGNKGKDGNMPCTSIEKMTTCIITKYGNEAAQEWTSRKKINLLKPVYSQATRDRHAARVRATRERIKLKLKSLRVEKTAIETKINNAPTSRGLLKELQEVDDEIAKGNIELNDEVEMRLTEDEKISHSNTWHTHGETTESLKSRGKVYTLLLGQCIQVLVDKMKQDTDWVTISESFDPSLLFKLIKKFVV